MGGFGDLVLEGSFRRFQLKQSRNDLIYLLSTVIIALIFLIFINLLNFSSIILIVIFSTQLLTAIILLVVLVKRTATIQFIIYGTIQLNFFVCFTLLPTGHSALLPTVLTIFALYSILSRRLIFSLIFATCLTVLQLVALLIFADPLFLTQFIATIIVHLWTHFTGFYSQTIRDKIARATFLRSRNAFAAEVLAQREHAQLTELISSIVPSHLVSAVRHQYTQNLSSPYTEKYTHVTVAFGRLIGLEEIFAQCSVQDCARLLNELSIRIDRIAKSHYCARIKSDGILAVSGIPTYCEDHMEMAVKFALDVQRLVKSFTDSAMTDLKFCCCIETGSMTCGIIGQNKWHYDIVGQCVDDAVNRERITTESGIFVSDRIRDKLGSDYEFDVSGGCWKVSEVKGCNSMPPGILFQSPRRISLMALPQAVNRLLQTESTAADLAIAASTMAGRRKRKTEKFMAMCDKTQGELKGESCINDISLSFRSSNMEAAFYKQPDRWFIPALAISIFYLVVYGTYHVLILPRQIATLVMIILALAVIFGILLMLYANYCEVFSQFITRTPLGQSVGTLLILTMLYICGIVNAYSCPINSTSGVDTNSECFVVHFSLYNFALWMLNTVVFVRYPSILLLLSLFVAFIPYLIQIFVTHGDLYENYSNYIQALSPELELLNGLLALAFVIFIQARRNEKTLRLDFLSKVKEVEEKTECEYIKGFNQNMLKNILPSHIAQSLHTKSESYYHLSNATGVACMQLLFDHDDDGCAISALRNMVAIIDQILMKHPRIEKIQNCQKMYIVAVGITPEICTNVHDTPSTIGDLLAELMQFSLTVSAIAANQGVSLNIGIECGSLLSAVVNSQNPTYEIVGRPYMRARILMQHADCYGILVSEEIYLALRPRNFCFDSRPIKLSSAMTAYAFEDAYPLGDTETNSLTTEMGPSECSSSRNLLENFESMETSLPSDIYSVDIGIETESDMEWITPDMMARNQHWQYPSTSGIDMSQYMLSSSNVRSDRSTPLGRFRNRRNRIMDWMSRSMLSDTGQQYDAADRLASAANRVDRMLEELNSIAGISPKNDCRPFPTTLSMSTKSLKRELSSTCHTEYDNAESESICSDTEAFGGRLEHLKKALKQCRGSSERRKGRRLWSNFDNGNEADIDSICSSLNVSSISDNLPWNSAHSIGYDDEYAFASQDDLRELARDQMAALSRDIRTNFGDYQLTMFPDIDA